MCFTHLERDVTGELWWIFVALLTWDQFITPHKNKITKVLRPRVYPDDDWIRVSSPTTHLPREEKKIKKEKEINIFWAWLVWNSEVLTKRNSYVRKAQLGIEFKNWFAFQTYSHEVEFLRILKKIYLCWWPIFFTEELRRHFTFFKLKF